MRTDPALAPSCLCRQVIGEPPPNVKPGRHMLALATYLGHANVMSTFWYLEATPILLRGIAEATEQAYVNGASHD